MLIVSNWKAYVETRESAKGLLATARKLANHGAELVVCPPLPYLGLLADGKTNVALGAQDVSGTTGGAETGEVTAGVIASVGVRYVIVGHSERRALGETDALIAEKVQHVLAHGMHPIVCVGERERDLDAHYLKLIRAELTAVLAPLSQKERMQVLIAYEPIWAIGKSAAESITAPDLTEMIAYIRKVIGEYLPGRAPERIQVLYGGSVEAENARFLAEGTGIDGFLVGHASADIETYTALVKAVTG